MLEAPKNRGSNQMQALQALKKEAINLLESNSIRKSLITFQCLIKDYPESFGVVFRHLTFLCGNLNDVTTGMLYVDKALQEFDEEKKHEVFSGKGDLYYYAAYFANTNEYLDNAIRAFQEAVRLNDSSFNIINSHNYIYLAHSYARQKKWVNMVDAFKKAEKCDANAGFYLHQAHSLVDAARESRNSSYDDSKNYLLLARNSINKCIEINPKYSEALITLASIDFFDNNDKEAEIHYREALQISRDNNILLSKIHLLYAQACSSFGKIKEAIEACEECLNENSKNLHAFHTIAELYKHQGDLLKARAYAFEYLKNSPLSERGKKLLEDINNQLNDGNPQPEPISQETTILLKPTSLASNHLIYEQLLGEGSFGIVYKGDYANIPVAVKCFSANVQTNFSIEVHHMTHLRHPRIIQVYGFNTDNGMQKIIMECAEKSLNAVLCDNTILLDGNTQFKFALDITYGLSYLHSKNVIHNDLKSHNILVNGERAKICDFGVAKLRKEGDQTILGSDVGLSIKWAPPEIFKRQKSGKDSDMYSYGVVLWELGARKTPLENFVGYLDISYELCDSAHKNRTEIENISPNTPPSMAILIGKCWETRRENRPTAKQAIEVIRKNTPSFGT